MRITFTISHSSETTLKPVPPKAHLFESLPLFPEADLNVLPDTDDKAELQVFQQVKDPLFRKTAICRQTDSRWRNGLKDQFEGAFDDRLFIATQASFEYLFIIGAPEYREGSSPDLSRNCQQMLFANNIC